VNLNARLTAIVSNMVAEIELETGDEVELLSVSYVAGSACSPSIDVDVSLRAKTIDVSRLRDPK
jgi:hypothetical protein